MLIGPVANRLLQCPADRSAEAPRGDEQPAAVGLELAHRRRELVLQRADALLVRLYDRLRRRARQRLSDRELVFLVEDRNDARGARGSCSPSFSMPAGTLWSVNLPIRPPATPPTTTDASKDGAKSPTTSPAPRTPSQTLAAQMAAMLDDRDCSDGIVPGQGRPFDSDGAGGLRWGVASICVVLTEHGVTIAPSTYYDTRRPSAQPPANGAMRNKPQIRRVHRDNFEVYAARKVWLQLNRDGIARPGARSSGGWPRWDPTVPAAGR
jgi:hypothetical protein